MHTDQSVPTTAGRQGPRALRARRVALHVVYGLLSLYALVMAQGAVRLALGQAPPGWHFWFATSTVFKLLVLGATVPLAWSAGRRVGAARWLALGLLTWQTAELLTGQFQLLSAVTQDLFWLGPWLLLAPERRRLLARPGRPPAVLAVGAAAAVAGCVAWALRDHDLVPASFPDVLPETDALAEFQLGTAGLPLALATASVLAVTALRRSRDAARTAGAACVVTGVAAVVWPDDLASAGLLGGGALVLWGTVLLLASAAGTRRTSGTAAARILHRASPGPADSEGTSMATHAVRPRPGRALLRTVLVAPLAALVVAPGTAQAAPPVAQTPPAPLTAVWWQEFMDPDTPAEGGDPLDRCDLGVGDVVFLAGSADGSAATRSCTVPAGTSLLVPLINTECSTLEGNGQTPAELRRCADDLADQFTDLSLSVDGVAVPVTGRFRVHSPVFRFTAAPGNPFGVQPGTTRSVADGYWALVRPLAPGETHVVSFGGSFPPADFSPSATYLITVEE